MGVRQFDCPECGAEVKVGLPRGATITSVRVPPPDAERRESDWRQTVCPNDHAVGFRFDR